MTPSIIRGRKVDYMEILAGTAAAGASLAKQKFVKIPINLDAESLAALNLETAVESAAVADLTDSIDFF